MLLGIGVSGVGSFLSWYFGWWCFGSLCIVVGAFTSGTMVSGGDDFARAEVLEQGIFWLFVIGIVWFFFLGAIG